MKWYINVLACILVLLGLASLTGKGQSFGLFLIAAGLIIVHQAGKLPK